MELAGGSAPGMRWAAAFGLHGGVLTAQRKRYALLKDQLVFKVDASGSTDPLTALASSNAANDNSDELDADKAGEPDSEEATSPANGSISHPLQNFCQGDGSSQTAGTGGNADWTQYFTDESLLEDINTDLDRLYPVGNESFFQNDVYIGALRRVLFVWCRLHPDVAYRQGMHDVAAVVLYSFLKSGNSDQTPSQGHTDQEPALPFMEEHVEADTFLVFESMMLYLKPFYEVVKSPVPRDSRRSSSVGDQNERRLFSTSTFKSSDDPHALFGEPRSSLSPSKSSGKPSDGGERGSAGDRRKPQPALHRLCYHLQYELLRQKDPQLYYHLQNLEIVPETYCLRWIRLLFAREFVFEELFYLWDAMIMDQSRAAIEFPDLSKIDSSDSLPSLNRLPKLMRREDVETDAAWVGFPLLRYLCVAKLLQLSPELLKSDNTGCLRLLMHSQQPAPEGEEHGGDVPAERRRRVMELTRFAKILQDPMLEEQMEEQRQKEEPVNPDSVEVVQFQAGSLGIVLTPAGAPFEDRLAVKSFTRDTTKSDGFGQAQASGKVHLGDILQSINGVPIVGITTEEVKRRLQLIDRPIHIGFRHRSQISNDESSTTRGSAVPSSSTGPDASPSEVPNPTFLPGEMCYANVETSIQRLVLSHDGSCLAHHISGKLFITSYRCFFTRLLGRGEIEWQVPVLSITSIDRVNPNSSSSLASGAANLALESAQVAMGFAPDDTYKVVIRCKDTQIARLSFADHGEYSKLVKCLSCLAFPASLLDAFCFSYSPAVAPSEEVPFDIRREYQRIGLLSFPDHLRCIDQSPRYVLCETYPQHLIVPTDISDVRIKAAAAFRSHSRLPVVSWIHRGNGATITRSSQPHVGLKSARSGEDELLVQLLCCSSNKRSFGKYVIMDARSQLAAVGNKAMGKGTEISSNYSGSKLMFMNIDNIHAIRQSLSSLAAIFEPRKGVGEDSSSSFYGKIESSGWLRHVRLVLKASVELARTVHNGTSVLTHCSDGWDRTAQMVALAELMLDPFYRTLRGFQVLVEKEWCSFGHQFALRCGHGRSDVGNDQRSPVFLLWLDCVWQYVRQFPTECEFNESLLLALADHVYSCKFGTFMFDCERQRKDFFAKHRAVSIWSEINSQSDRFTNHMYAPSSERVGVLSPSTLSKNVKLWKGYFCRWDPTVIPPVPALQYY